MDEEDFVVLPLLVSTNFSVHESVMSQLLILNAPSVLGLQLMVLAPLARALLMLFAHPCASAPAICAELHLLLTSSQDAGSMKLMPTELATVGLLADHCVEKEMGVVVDAQKALLVYMEAARLLASMAATARWLADFALLMPLMSKPVMPSIPREMMTRDINTSSKEKPADNFRDLRTATGSLF